jgi:DNA-binding protein HU-beta
LVLSLKLEQKKLEEIFQKNTTIKIPAHNIPAFKPAKVFVEGVKNKN